MISSVEELVAVLVYAYVITSPSNAFNIEVRSARIYSPPTGSGTSFGYTVAQLVSHDKKWLVFFCILTYTYDCSIILRSYV